MLTHTSTSSVERDDLHTAGYERKTLNTIVSISACIRRTWLPYVVCRGFCCAVRAIVQSQLQSGAAMGDSNAYEQYQDNLLSNSHRVGRSDEGFPVRASKYTNKAHARGTTPVMAIMDLDPCKSPYVQLLFLFAAQANVAGAVRPVQLELQHQPWRERTNASCEATVHP